MEKKEAQNILKKAPDVPGVYKMTSEDGTVIYIGKAKSLKKRLRQYFQKDYAHSTRTKKLMEKAKNITYTATDTELEAKILELNMIKQFKPKYNVIMKDDKNYVYIKITKEDFPRVQIVRKVERDGAKYYGPKTAAHKVKSTFKILKKIFPFRHCNLDIADLGEGKVKVTRKVIKYPCLDYYIKRCIAPCIAKCSKEEYAQIIKGVQDFLEGRADEVLANLEATMRAHAANRQFEKAAKVRDKIQKAQEILEKQNVAAPDTKSQDVINYIVTHSNAYFNLFQVRDGKLIGQENFILCAKDLEDSDSEEVLEAFLQQYYEMATDVPDEIVIPHQIDTPAIHEKALYKTVTIPQKGKKHKLLEMSLNNARIYADRNKPSWKQESTLTKAAAEELAQILKLPEAPKRIECYDISHLSGTETVGSMVVFKNGAPAKDHYRKFRLRTVQNKPDDYKSMEEVLTRRLSKIAQAYAHRDYQFKKSRKKDTKFIEENNRVKLSETDRTFYVLEKEKSLAGFIATKDHSAKVAELSNLWVHPDYRGEKLGYKLLKDALSKVKSKRVYIMCKPELREYYQLAGFEEIKKTPDEIGRASCRERV